VVGALHDRLDSWSVALGACAALCVAMAIIGLYAGRALQIGGFREHAARPVPAAH
jgi:CP family cyanate transporter-like MFS transporter